MRHRVLVFCGDQYHPADDVMEGLSASCGREFEFEKAPDGALEVLKGAYSAIVLAKLNATSETDSNPWADSKSDDLIGGFAGSGKGLLVVHAGTVGYGASPAIRNITGGSFLRHPEPCDVTFEPMPGQTFLAEFESFTVRDEHYYVDADPSVEIFLQSRSDSGVQPAGWTNKFGKGRAAVLTPGHFEHVWKHGQMHALVQQTLGWLVNG